ncbi:unnamed protein product [marine sediment metagenome]|uniref:Uncharacterized protein n=1 Tax=marine sediment metagenome TaxID=412755 RepID=X0RK37_9ZZZZ
MKAYGMFLFDLAKVETAAGQYPRHAATARAGAGVNTETGWTPGLIDQHRASNEEEMAAILARWDIGWHEFHGANLLAILVKKLSGDLIKVRYWNFEEMNCAEPGHKGKELHQRYGDNGWAD